jgi:hypothetical protein
MWVSERVRMRLLRVHLCVAAGLQDSESKIAERFRCRVLGTYRMRVYQGGMIQPMNATCKHQVDEARDPCCKSS